MLNNDLCRDFLFIYLNWSEWMSLTELLLHSLWGLYHYIIIIIIVIICTLCTCTSIVLYVLICEIDAKEYSTGTGWAKEKGRKSMKHQVNFQSSKNHVFNIKQEEKKLLTKQSKEYMFLSVNVDKIHHFVYVLSRKYFISVYDGE